MFNVELPNILGKSLVNSDIPSPTRATCTGETPFALIEEKPVVLVISKAIVVYIIHMSIRMRDKRLMLRQEGASCCIMSLKPKHTGLMILKSNFQSRRNV